MLNFNQTITIYNKLYDATSKKTLWPKTVIRGASWAGYQRGGVGIKAASGDSYSVRIPVENMPSGFLERTAFVQSTTNTPDEDNPNNTALLGTPVRYYTAQTGENTYCAQDIPTKGWDIPNNTALLGAPVRYYTAQTGDIVLLGEGADVVDGDIAAITRAHTECFTVTAVHTANMHRPLAHLRIEGR